MIASAGAALADAPPAPPPKVTIDTGTVAGTVVDQARVFKAIPYAAPPVGALRWRPPQPAAHWTGARDATQDGPACPQVVYPGRYNEGGYQGPTSEDCLTLDVFAPLHAAHAPVMVWIFGGGDVAGADSIAPNDGRFFARDGVILVAMNYRLGALGFFAHPALTRAAKPGEPLANYGLMDQIAALEWVKRNIARFGGDPANVTIFGESAGGENVQTLMVTPSARGLFQRATVQSGDGWGPSFDLAKAEAAGVALAQKLGLPPDATADQLRALPVDKLVGTGPTGPIVDGRLVTESAEQGFAHGRQAAAPLIIGSNSWEASLLPKAGYDAYAGALSPAVRAAYPDEAGDPAKLAQAAFTDAMMAAPARWYAAQASKKGGAWLYEFPYVRVVRRGKIPGANHTSENPYVFDTQMIVPNYSSEIVDADRVVAGFMHSCWVSFAKTGKPTCMADGRAWPAYSPKTDELMVFDNPPRIVAHYRKPQLDAQEAAQGSAIKP
ncbi:MAG TPA: carboxylesterase family protein [Caulobacteraceae bacterium]|nr:carboxylesterase family protein [Caulobacteraceae bacterium]